MSIEPKPDLACVPYRRRWLYYSLTIPMLALLLLVLIYLGTFHPTLSIVFFLFYLDMSFFQAYCCVYQDCPYVGSFCPAILGIFSANLIAKILYKDRGFHRSKKKFDTYAAIAVVGWLGLIAFPLYWISKIGLPAAIGYVGLHAIYAVTFVLTICPRCAINGTCPGGAVNRFIRKLVSLDRINRMG